MNAPVPDAIPVEERNLHIASLPKRHLVNFLEATNENPNATYSFVIKKANTQDAKDFLHRMRVELSRKKAVLLDKGYKVPKFAMLVKSYSFNPLQNTTTITLSRVNDAQAEEFANLLFATKGEQR